MSERLVSFASGGGTTTESIIRAVRDGRVPMEIACIISSSADAGVIAKAKELGIPDKDIVVVNPNSFRGEDGKVDQKAFGQTIVRVLLEHGATVGTQNGWMPKTPEDVIDAIPLYNQHPGPVPEFGGKGMFGRRVHAARLYFVQKTNRNFWTEVVAQKVHRNYDQGVVVKYARVEILPNDTVEDLQQRALYYEHQVQIEMLQDHVTGRIQEYPHHPGLVMPEEAGLLIEAKNYAQVHYPHG